MANKKKKNFLYNFMTRDGKGVKKEEILGPPNLKNFFKLFSRKVTTLLTVNLMFVFGNFPFIFVFMAISGNFHAQSTAASSHMFGPLHGILLHSPNTPASAALFGVYGLQFPKYYPSVWVYVLFGLATLLLFTYGPVSSGFTYLIRNMVRQKPIFLWSDFVDTIKRNIKQSIPLGIIDLLFSFLICYDIVFFFANTGTFTKNLMFWLAIVISVLYVIMRFYMYILLVTFDLKIKKIIKNSFIFTLLGFKRNIVAFLGIVALILINYYLYIFVPPIGFIFPFVFLFAWSAFIAAYAAFPIIKRYMIDPYYEEKTDNETGEKIFTDRTT